MNNPILKSNFDDSKIVLDRSPVSCKKSVKFQSN